MQDFATAFTGVALGRGFYPIQMNGKSLEGGALTRYGPQNSFVKDVLVIKPLGDGWCGLFYFDGKTSRYGRVGPNRGFYRQAESIVGEIGALLQ